MIISIVHVKRIGSYVYIGQKGPSFFLSLFPFFAASDRSQKSVRKPNFGHSYTYYCITLWLRIRKREYTEVSVVRAAAPSEKQVDGHKILICRTPASGISECKEAVTSVMPRRACISRRRSSRRAVHFRFADTARARAAALLIAREDRSAASIATCRYLSGSVRARACLYSFASILSYEIRRGKYITRCRENV